MTDDGAADDRNSDYTVRGSKWTAQQFYFAYVLFVDGGYFLHPRPRICRQKERTHCSRLKRKRYF